MAVSVVRLPPPLIVNWPLSASPTPSSCDRVPEDPVPNVTPPAALLPMVVRLATSVFSEPETVTPELMLKTLAEPLPETVAVVSISVSSTDVGGALAGVEVPSVVVQDDATPNGSLASVVFNQKRVRGFAGMFPSQNMVEATGADVIEIGILALFTVN